MNTLSIPFHQRVFYFQWPSFWDEITAETLKALFAIIKEAQAAFLICQEAEYKEPADLELQELRIEMMGYLLDLRCYHWLKKRAFISLYADELHDILNETDFLIERPLGNVPSFAEIRVDRLTLIPPGDSHSSKIDAFCTELSCNLPLRLDRAFLNNSSTILSCFKATNCSNYSSGLKQKSESLPTLTFCKTSFIDIYFFL